MAQKRDNESATEEPANPNKRHEPSSSSSSSPATSSEVSSQTTNTQDLAALLGLSTGNELEIKWDMTSEETGEVTPRWWPCKLLSAVGSHTLQVEEDEEDKEEEDEPYVGTLYEIEYEAFLPDYPDKAIHRIVFLSDRQILDVGENAMQSWRNKGDSWDEDEEDGEQGNTEQGNIAVASTAEFVDSLLSSVTGKYQETISKLPYLQQSFIASVMSRSKERLAEKLEQTLNKKNAQGLSREVSKEDMEALLAQVGQDLQAIKNSAVEELAHPSSA